MFRGLSITALKRGNYKALPEDGKDVGTASSRPRVQLFWAYFILSTFCGFVLALILVNLFPGKLIRTYGDAEKTNLEKLFDLSTKTVIFTPDSTFQEAPTPESDLAWQSLLGPSLGLVSLNHSDKYGLPPGAPGAPKAPHTDIYQVSVAHQIQCLFLIRKVFWSSTAQPSSDIVSYTSHCFDYLLQSVRCAADMTLEWKTDSNGNFVGWDVPHTCKDWESVMSFMTKYKYDEAEKAINHHDHDG